MDYFPIRSDSFCPLPDIRTRNTSYAAANSVDSDYGFISALLVPGLIVHWFNIGNPFVAASITGITVFGFESIVAVLKKRLVNKLDNDGDK